MEFSTTLLVSHSTNTVFVNSMTDGVLHNLPGDGCVARISTQRSGVTWPGGNSYRVKRSKPWSGLVGVGSWILQDGPLLIVHNINGVMGALKMGNWGFITPISGVISPYIYNWFSGTDLVKNPSTSMGKR